MNWEWNLRRYDYLTARLGRSLSTKAPQDINVYMTIVYRQGFQDTVDGKEAEPPRKGTGNAEQAFSRAPRWKMHRAGTTVRIGLGIGPSRDDRT